MKIDALTIFPGLFQPFLSESLIGRARERGLVDIRVHDLRDFTTDRHRVVDDEPYGGGAGMVMKPEPFFAAIRSLKAEGTLIVLMSPKGRRLTHELVERLTNQKHLLLLCGRYEGIDDRVRQRWVDEEISIGDYVLNGGELPAMVLIEAVTRLLPGVVKETQSIEKDSFYRGLLDYPHYTRPPVIEDMDVPEVLLSGNHKEIDSWRRRKSLETTFQRRPELLESADLTTDDQKYLAELERERQQKDDGHKSKG